MECKSSLDCGDHERSLCEKWRHGDDTCKVLVPIDRMWVLPGVRLHGNKRATMFKEDCGVAAMHNLAHDGYVQNLFCTAAVWAGGKFAYPPPLFFLHRKQAVLLVFLKDDGFWAWKSLPWVVKLLTSISLVPLERWMTFAPGTWGLTWQPCFQARRGMLCYIHDD